MKQLFGIVVLGVALSVTALLMLLPTPLPELAQGTSAVPGSAVLIENVYLTDRQGQRTTTSLLLHNGLIQRIGDDLELPDDVDIIDAAGLTAVPGLIDSHTHSYGTALEDALRFGVTTNVDMFSPPAVLPGARSSRNSIEPTTVADLFSAGMLATAQGGHGTQFGIPIDTLAAPADAAPWVRARREEGSDFIKLVYMPYQSYLPSLDRATAKAVIDAAHSEGLMVVAHISSQHAAMDMLEEGIDGLVHVFADEPVSDAFLKLAVANKVFVIPTLAVIASVAKTPNPLMEEKDQQKWLSSMQKQTLATEFPAIGTGFNFSLALQNVLRLHEAGITVLAGSDAPNPGTAHGLSLHHELALLVEAGLSPAEAIRAATELPAQVFALEGRGLLAVGQRADIALVQGNPYQNIGASRQIRRVIKNGFNVDRVEAAVATAPTITSNVLGSFDNDLRGPDGLSWDTTVDAVAGGNSTATATRVRRTSGGYALAVTANVKPGFAYPWAGAGLGSANQNAFIDVSRFNHIVFEVKGTPGRYRFMLFSGMGAGAPPTQEFAVTNNWQTVSLPIEKFAGFRPAEFSMLGIVAGPVSDSVEFVIDEVRFEE